MIRALTRRPPRGVQRLESETIVPLPLDATFAFFAAAENLERLTPPWLAFRITSSLPIVMGVGTIIDYRIWLHGLPIPWRSQIDVWEPGKRFVDRQLVGPYLWWHHTHRFEAVNGVTRVIDEVEYTPRLAWLTATWVSRDLERIFGYRREALRKWSATKLASG